MTIRVLRVYHAGRDRQHRGRERALDRAGIDVTLVVPTDWPEASAERDLSVEPFRIIEMPLRHGGEVNRHAYVGDAAIRRVVADTQPDVLDIHEEPVGVVARQWLAAAAELPVVMYTAQNVDKRFPPPFSRFEAAALRRVAGFYPCSRQAASVIRGKGFAGAIEVLPLGFDDALFQFGAQSLDNDEVVLMFAGRLVPEKGLDAAVFTLARVNAVCPARLIVPGSGPEVANARALASSLGVEDRLQITEWQSGAELASSYRAAHVVLVPSRSTDTWVEQFGRVIVEAQASGAVVVGYGSGAIPEVAGDAGIVVPPGDSERLADEVVRVLADPDEFARRREAGRLQAATRTWSAVASRQAALYRAVCDGHTAPLKIAKSPARRRADARAEFGPPASTTAGDHPFALPILRRGGVFARWLAAAIDVGQEMASRLSR